MKATVTPEAENAIADIAQRYGLSREAVLAMCLPSTPVAAPWPSSPSPSSAGPGNGCGAA